MKQWWRSLQARERITLTVAAGLLGLLLLHGLVWQPWQQAHEDLREAIEQRQSDLQWMREAILRLPQGRGPATSASPGGNLVTRMNRLLVEARLRDRMKQMKPAGDKEVRLRFEKARFDGLLRLLSGIEQQGLKVRELRVLPADQPGIVNASLVVQR